MTSLGKTRCICPLANKSILNERNLSVKEFLGAKKLDRKALFLRWNILRLAALCLSATGSYNSLDIVWIYHVFFDKRMQILLWLYLGFLPRYKRVGKMFVLFSDENIWHTNLFARTIKMHSILHNTHPRVSFWGEQKLKDSNTLAQSRHFHDNRATHSTFDRVSGDYWLTEYDVKYIVPRIT